MAGVVDHLGLSKISESSVEKILRIHLESLHLFPEWSGDDRKAIVAYYYARARSASLHAYCGRQSVIHLAEAKKRISMSIDDYVKWRNNKERSYRSASLRRYKKHNKQYPFVLNEQWFKETIAQLEKPFIPWTKKGLEKEYIGFIAWAKMVLEGEKEGHIAKYLKADLETIFDGPGWLKHRETAIASFNRWLGY